MNNYEYFLHVIRRHRQHAPATSSMSSFRRSETVQTSELKIDRMPLEVNQDLSVDAYEMLILAIQNPVITWYTDVGNWSYTTGDKTREGLLQGRKHLGLEIPALTYFPPVLRNPRKKPLFKLILNHPASDTPTYGLKKRSRRSL